MTGWDPRPPACAGSTERAARRRLLLPAALRGPVTALAVGAVLLLTACSSGSAPGPPDASAPAATSGTALAPPQHSGEEPDTGGSPPGTPSAPVETTSTPDDEEPDTGGSPPGTPSAPVETTSTPDDEEPPPGGATDGFEQFVDACAESFEGWRPGQATYPRELDIDLSDARTYTARIDIRPEAQRQPPPAPDVATAELQVRCGIGARLVAVGSSVSVDDGDWFLAEFGAPGIVQWDWTVTAETAHDAELRLELRPAVAAVDGGYTVPAEQNPKTATTSFTTDVHVRTSFLQQVGVWFDENWPIITTVAVALGAAVLGVVVWVKKLGTAVGRGAATSPTTRTPPRKAARRR